MMNLMRQEKTLLSFKKNKLDSVFPWENLDKKKHRKENSVKDIKQKKKEEEKIPKTKSITEFDKSLPWSIKSIAVKKNKKKWNNKTND